MRVCVGVYLCSCGTLKRESRGISYFCSGKSVAPVSEAAKGEPRIIDRVCASFFFFFLFVYSVTDVSLCNVRARRCDAIVRESVSSACSRVNIFVIAACRVLLSSLLFVVAPVVGPRGITKTDFVSYLSSLPPPFLVSFSSGCVFRA